MVLNTGCRLAIRCCGFPSSNLPSMLNLKMVGDVHSAPRSMPLLRIPAYEYLPTVDWFSAIMSLLIADGRKAKL